MDEDMKRALHYVKSVTKDTLKGQFPVSGKQTKKQEEAAMDEDMKRALHYVKSVTKDTLKGQFPVSGNTSSRNEGRWLSR